MIKHTRRHQLTLCEHLKEHESQCYVHYQDQQYELLAWKPVLYKEVEKTKLINIWLSSRGTCHSWRLFWRLLKLFRLSNWDRFLLIYKLYANKVLYCMHNKYSCNFWVVLIGEQLSLVYCTSLVAKQKFLIGSVN